MILKPRTISTLLQILRLLHPRMNFSQDYQKLYDNLEKGIEGEFKFDQLLEELSIENILLKDLVLKWNNTTFQIDTSMLTQTTLYHFEVKNYEGEYSIKEGNWYFYPTGKLVTNPLIQLNRTKGQLEQMLSSLQLQFNVKSYLIFPNPEFTLFNNSGDLPIILASQLNKFIKQLNGLSSTLQAKHTKLAEKMIFMHNQNESEFSFQQVPEYTFEGLKKGIICSNNDCHSFINSLHRWHVCCDACNELEDVEAAVLRSIEEYNTLFPNMRITTKAIYIWCGKVIPKKTVWRILKTNYTYQGYGPHRYYIEKH